MEPNGYLEDHCDEVDGILHKAGSGKKVKMNIVASSVHHVGPGKLGETRNMASRAVPPQVCAIAKQLSADIVQYVAYPYKNGTKLQLSYARTMRRTVDELSERHEILFKSMIAKLKITKANCKATFIEVADEIFRDGQYNWGRIVSVYAFGGRLAKYCAEHDMEDYVDTVTEFVGDYVAQKLGTWIISQKGGWDAFDEYFPDQRSLEDRIWKGLLLTAFGLGAIATMVAAR